MELQASYALTYSTPQCWSNLFGESRTLIEDETVVTSHLARRETSAENVIHAIFFYDPGEMGQITIS